MSLQELHIKALEQQVVNLTRDCHYLMSLLNSTDNIDWDSWEQGRKIKEDLEHSKDFFDAMNRRQEQIAERENARREAARKAAEEIKRVEAEKRAREQRKYNDPFAGGFQSIFDALETFRLF